MFQTHAQNHYAEESRNTVWNKQTILFFSVHFTVVILKQNRKNLKACQVSDENPIPKQD